MADLISTMFGGGAQKDAAAKNALALQQYGGTATGALQQGYTTGTADLTKAVGAYDPLAALGQKYGGATDLYLGALGAGGPAGTAAAQSAFTNAPGYTGTIDAATQAMLRQMGTQGMSRSGNTAIDAGQIVQNEQNKQYNTWLQNLAQAGQTGVSATGAAAAGQAQGYGSLANLGYTYGSDQGGIAGNIASGTMADNNMVAAGQAAGAKNLLGAGLSLATLGMGGMGGMGGLGSLGSALSSGASSAYGGMMGQPWQQANTGKWGSSFAGPVAPG